MEFVEKRVGRNFNVFFIGDLHIGAKLFYERGLQSVIKEVQKPYEGVRENYIIGMGDYIEAVDITDKRFNLKATATNKTDAKEQMDAFIKLMKPVKKNILYLLEGNHEYKNIRYFNLVQYAAEQLNTVYGTYTTICTFTCRGKTLFKVYTTHGSRSINSTSDSLEMRQASMLRRLKSMLYPLAGDCAVMAMGHTHKLLVAEPVGELSLVSQGNKVEHMYLSTPQDAVFIPKDHRYYVNTGSMLRLFGQGYSSYTERAMYAPLELGYPILRVRNGKIAGVDRCVF